jgi:CBS domain-containing protein
MPTETILPPQRGPAVGELVRGALATCDVLDTLRDVAARLTDDVIGAVLVGRADQVVGVVSERDLTRAMSEGADVEDARARDVMTDQVVMVPATTTAAEAARRMLDDEIRHLAVTDEDGHVVGMVSMREVLAALLG